MNLATQKFLFQNLPPNKKASDLFNMLEPHGALLWAYLPIDRKNMQPLGFAFVEMMLDLETNNIVNLFNNFKWDNYPLKVKALEQVITPEMEDDKTQLLYSSIDFIYSVIRLQVYAPASSVIFINGVIMDMVNQTGFTAIRGLLPGAYRVQVVYQNYLLADKLVNLNCIDALPPLKAAFDPANPPKLLDSPANLLAFPNSKVKKNLLQGYHLAFLILGVLIAIVFLLFIQIVKPK